MPSFPEGAQAVLNYLLSVGITSAALGGLASWLTTLFMTEKIKGKIKSEYDAKLETLKAQLKGQYDEKLETHRAQLKAQTDVEIETLKAELTITAARNQFLFSTLHEKRAEIIANVYASLREAIICLSEYTKAFEPIGGTSREERRQNAADAVNAFTKLFFHNEIFIPERAANKLHEINQELKIAFIQFLHGVDQTQGDNRDHMTSWVQVEKRIETLSNLALRELERDFRTILGDKNPVSTY
jgi:hypothetical protein